MASLILLIYIIHIYCILFPLSLFLSLNLLFVEVVFPSHIVFPTLRWPDLSLSISLWCTEVDVPCLNLFRERQQFITANPLLLWVCTKKAFIRWSVALRMHLLLQFIEEQWRQEPEALMTDRSNQCVRLFCHRLDMVFLKLTALLCVYFILFH